MRVTFSFFVRLYKCNVKTKKRKGEEKMLHKKWMVGIVSAVMCLGMLGGTAAASGSESDNPVSSNSQVFLVEDGEIQFVTPSITSDPVTAISGTESLTIGTTPSGTPKGTYLANGGCGISRIEDYIARVDGYTNCYRQAEYVYLGLCMDRLEDGAWHTVWYKNVDAEDAYSLSYAVNVLVKEGYYYRVRAAHMAQNGDIREGNTSATDGIRFGNVS